ncbi:MAG: NYN domain-containing protein [Burkholderiaceae bacterium]
MDLRKKKPPHGGFFISSAKSIDVADKIRTIVYVDGFNLYFGCLKSNKARRWLDIQKLFNRLCHENDPLSDVVEIKYFTAPIKSKLSPRGAVSSEAQSIYLRALEKHCQRLTVVLGHYQIVRNTLLLDQSPINFDQKVAVIRPEEKQTDVNIAVHMLCDAAEELCDQQVLVTNDTDCVPILKAIREKYPSIRLGVIAPLPDGEKERRPSAELVHLSDWSRNSFRDEELRDSQLPDIVKTKKRYLRKPSHW